MKNVYKGASVSWVIELVDSDETAQDISGWTGWLTIKENKLDASGTEVPDASAVLQKKVVLPASPAAYEIDLSLTPTETENNFEVGKTYYVDTQMKDASGAIIIGYDDIWYVKARVTQDQ